MKHRRSPQEKKVLSYVKDRMETFAEARSIAHRAISKRKRAANSAYRLLQEAALRGALRTAGDPLDQADAAVRGISRDQGRAAWRKFKSAPLLDYRDSRRGRNWWFNARGELRMFTEPYELPATDSAAARRARLKLKRKRGRL